MVFKTFIDYIEAEKKALTDVRRQQNQNTITNIRPSSSSSPSPLKKKNTTKKTNSNNNNNKMGGVEQGFANQAAESRGKKSGGATSSTATKYEPAEGDHPAKNKTVRPKDMTDQEKINALRTEIDNLRSQVYDSNTIGNQRVNPYERSTSSTTTTSTASGSAHAMLNLSMLAVAVLVVVALMARLKRHQRRSSSGSSGRYSQVFPFGPVSLAVDDPEMGRSFELRPTSTSSITTEPEIIVTDRATTTTTTPAAAYEAPDAADVRLV
jgi:cobalamin biosynthesis Mg chelatase CobN